MVRQRFFDQALALIEAGEVPPAMCMVAGQLFEAQGDPERWERTRAAFRSHRLHDVLLEDSFSAYAAAKPRGYPGDAGLIDMIYDRRPAPETTERGHQMFGVSIQFPVAEAVRLRLHAAKNIVETAWRNGQRILVLACGHFREGDGLRGEDVSNIMLVDQDAESLDRARAMHDGRVGTAHANVFRFLRQAASTGQRYDLVYTLGLTDYLDAREMRLLHRLVHAVMAPGGRFILANFLPDHLGIGWMDAVMDWHLIYRDGTELAEYAQEAGLTPNCWTDPTNSIVWCSMLKPE